MDRSHHCLGALRSGFTTVAIGLFITFSSATASAQYADWKHSGSIFLLTTPDGAHLPAAAVVENFPVLVRLDKDFFDFSQAMPQGEDVRFATASGEALAYQVEAWDAKAGQASIWVRMPTIHGNARQELKMYWGKPDAASESSGKAVFNATNGYVSVLHLGETVQDEVGTVEAKNIGTTDAPGVVAQARHFAGRQGIFCGEQIPSLPSGASSHSTSAWFRIERPNATIIGWGNEGGGRGSKIRMQLRSPPHIHIDSDFSDVKGEGRLPLGKWVHVVHTYDREDGQIYIDGVLDGRAKPLLDIKSPARMWIGGWYHNYDFIGDIDEVRISRVARSPEWVRLEYENQKPLQTLVGPLVQAGQEFSVSQTKVAIAEGQSVTLAAKAGGAQKIYWIERRNGTENVVAIDRFSYPLLAGRVAGDESFTLQFKAVYPNETKTIDVPVKVQERIAEPEFTLVAPARWDGRKTIEVVPQITNLAQLQANGAGELKYRWTATGVAVIKQVAPDKLVLLRAQNSGPVTITAAISNGGQETSQAVTIQAQEPAHDAWVERTPAKDEQPEEGQFFARDDTNNGTLHYRGTLKQKAESVFLKLYADDQLVHTESGKLGDDNTYALSTKLKPGLIKYKVEFGSKTGDTETVLHGAGNLVCGDAYLINGQSNAVATDFGKEDPAFRSEWIRTFGSMSGNPQIKARWGLAVHRSRDAENLQIGYWGMELGKRLVETHQVPVCILNGAVGGTRIDQHQRNQAEPEDGTTIYGRLLRRVREAELTHGIRAVLWHQGENDQGADGPTGGYGWETYHQYFVELAGDWKQDYPNIQHYYLFQIWPKSCSMGINGSDNRLREVQRSLPQAFSRMSIMSTLGIDPPGGCHFPAAGYAEFARLICPLVERDFYGKAFATSITPPNLQRARFANSKQDELVLEFDQPVKWDNNLIGQFYLDGVKGQIVSGAVEGSTLTLKLAATSTANKVTYLDSAAWSQDKLLRGENGLAALTFCEVPIKPAKP